MKLIFDVGCNQGRFCEAATKLHPEAQIVAVDANAAFQKNFENNPNVTFINALVAKEDDSFEKFYMDYCSSGTSTACKDWTTKSRFAAGSKYVQPMPSWSASPVLVPTVTLDTLIKTYGNPEFIKIDVEGYEFEVLSGLTTKQQIIAFEWTEEFKEKLLQCVEYLYKLGYKQFGMVGFFEEGAVFENVTHSSEGDPHMKEPDKYVPYEMILTTINKVCIPERRINYGMFFVK